jgi:hypothetical protein
MRGVPDGTAAAPGIAFETDPNTGIYSPGADQLAVATNGTGRLFVDASGNVGVLQIEGTTFENSGGSFTCNNALLTQAPIISLNKSAGGSVGSNTLVSSGSILGLLTFQGNDGTEFVQAADIKAEVDGTPGANDMPGRLVFSTTADGASSPTERMRITSRRLCPSCIWHWWHPVQRRHRSG